jgi:hypothetical protein
MSDREAARPGEEPAASSFQWLGLEDEAAGSEAPSAAPRVRMYTALELVVWEAQPTRWAVEGLLPEGLALLAGRPKQGKSWLALQLALAITEGRPALGSLPVTQGEALYLALEDPPRRLKERQERLLAGRKAPGGLGYIDLIPRMDRGGLDALRELVESNRALRLVVIDTLACFRPLTPTQGDPYVLDYRVMTPLKRLAEEHHLALLVVHHQRKLPAEDPVDTVTGSVGLTGAVDTVMVLERPRLDPQATLYMKSRDMEMKELALAWDDDTCTWRLTGTAEESRRSDERRAILNLLTESPEPLTPKQVAEALGKNHSTTKNILWQMARQQLLAVTSSGGYSVPRHLQLDDPSGGLL